MNQSFLDIYPQLIDNHQNTHSHQTISGLWLAHGEEALMTQWLVEALRPHWHKQGQNISRIELKSSKTWQEVLAQLDSLSLFNPANAIIVTGNHKPDKETQTSLAHFANRIQQEQTTNPTDIHNHLLWIAPKQDKRALTAKWTQVFSQSGRIIDCNVFNESHRQQILQIHAQNFGLHLTSEAWQLLISHTENNLLNAYQTLWRVSYLYVADDYSDKKSDLTINADSLLASLVSESNYSVYDLSDAMVSGNTEQVVKIMNGLRNTGESPIRILWTISKDMRLIQQLISGKKPQEIGIWSSKQGLYNSAMRRIQLHNIDYWSKLLFDCDCAIKGVIKQPVWELLLQAALEVSGIRLFNR